MNNFINRLKVVYDLLKEGDFNYIYRGIRRRLYSQENFIGLKRDLHKPFKAPKAKIELAVRLLEDRDLEYFNMTHTDDILLNKHIPYCYVATTKNDIPCFRQWLIHYETNKEIKDLFKGIFPILKKDEALLEGGFIPPKNRGLGIMPAGICEVISKGITDNVRYIITFVGEHNIASLKGCSRAGFYPYILRTEKWFLFNKKVRFTAIPHDIITYYKNTVAEKPKPLTKKMHLV